MVRFSRKTERPLPPRIDDVDDVHFFMRRPGFAEASFFPTDDFEQFIFALDALDVASVPTVAGLRSWGLPEAIAADLDALVSEGQPEETIVLSFLALLRTGTRYRPSRLVRVRIAWMCKRRGVDRRFVEGRVTPP